MQTLKRLLALALVLVMMGGLVPVNVRATGDVSPQADCTHSSTKLVPNGSATHDVVCANSDCSAKISTSVACSAQGSYYQNESGHYQKCACGNNMTGDAHAFTTPKKDTNDHWNECICGAKDGVAAHAYGDWTSVNDTTHKKTCTCGAEATANHAHPADAAGTTKTPATCTALATVEYTCQDCNTPYTVSEGSLAPHTYPETLTWEKADNISHKSKELCSVCQAAGTEKQGSHVPTNEGQVTTTPGCTTAGVRTFQCSVCSDTYTTPEPATGHTVTAWAEDAEDGKHSGTCDTCTATISGDCTPVPDHDTTNHWMECSVCGKQTGVTAHTLVWMADGTQHWQECVPTGTDTCSYETEEAAHDTENVAIVSATCTTAGTLAHQACKNCGKKLLSGALVEDSALVISASNAFHSLTAVAAAESTCQAEGKIAHVRCSVCNQNFADTAAAEAGTALTTVATEKKAHTYTSVGYATETEHLLTCAVCGDSAPDPENHIWDLTDLTAIKCTKCNYQHIHTTSYTASTATCAAAGNAAYYTCTKANCPLTGKKYSDAALTQEITDLSAPQLTHTLTDVAEVPATCKADGMAAHKYCPTCKLYFTTAGAATTQADLKITKLTTHTTATPAAYAFDNTNHWQICTVCDTKVGSAAHSAETVCTLCGYQKDHDHTKTLTFRKGTATCKTAGTWDTYTCTYCKQVFVDAAATVPYSASSHSNVTLPHTPDNTKWYFAHDGHWRACTVCGGEAIAQTSHSLGTDNKCTVCGYDAAHVKCTSLTFNKGTATCTKSGTPDTYVCNYCLKVWTDKDATNRYVSSTHDGPLPHTPNESMWHQTATQHYRSCTVCKQQISSTTAAHAPIDGACTTCGYDPTGYKMTSSPSAPVSPTGTATFTSSADRDTLIAVTVDGWPIRIGVDCLVRSGSTVVTLTPAYLSSLEGGTHNLSIISRKGDDVQSVSAPFTIDAKLWQKLYFTKSLRTLYLGDPSFTNPLVHEKGDGAITYKSSNTKVATVDKNGVVTLKGTGECTIYAYASETTAYEAATASFLLRVYESGDNPKTADAPLTALLVLTGSAAALVYLFLKNRKVRYL